MQPLPIQGCIINDLPPELLENEIFDYILPQDWKMVRCTCKRWASKVWLKQSHRRIQESYSQLFRPFDVYTLWRVFFCGCRINLVADSCISSFIGSHQLRFQSNFIILQCKKHEMQNSVKIRISIWKTTDFGKEGTTYRVTFSCFELLWEWNTTNCFLFDNDVGRCESDFIVIRVSLFKREKSIRMEAVLHVCWF